MQNGIFLFGIETQNLEEIVGKIVTISINSMTFKICGRIEGIKTGGFWCGEKTNNFEENLKISLNCASKINYSNWIG